MRRRRRPRQGEEEFAIDFECTCYRAEMQIVILDGQQHFRMRLTGDERSMGCGSGPVSAPMAVWRPHNTPPKPPLHGFAALYEATRA